MMTYCQGVHQTVSSELQNLFLTSQQKAEKVGKGERLFQFKKNTTCRSKVNTPEINVLNGVEDLRAMKYGHKNRSVRGNEI